MYDKIYTKKVKINTNIYLYFIIFLCDMFFLKSIYLHIHIHIVSSCVHFYLENMIPHLKMSPKLLKMDIVHYTLVWRQS